MTAHRNEVDDYIQTFPGDVQEKLTEIRKTILEIAPEASEQLFYKVPSITLTKEQKPKDGLMFAAFKNHIGLYPKPEVIKRFEDQIKALNLKYAEGTIQFPLHSPVPIDLLQQIIKYKLAHNE